MSSEEIRELLRHEPFEPFRVRLTSGDAYEVVGPNSLALGKSRAFLAFPDADRWAAFAYLQVAAVESINGNGQRRRKRRE